MDSPESLSPQERRELLDRCDTALALCDAAMIMELGETRSLTLGEASAILRGEVRDWERLGLPR